MPPAILGAIARRQWNQAKAGDWLAIGDEPEAGNSGLINGDSGRSIVAQGDWLVHSRGVDRAERFTGDPAFNIDGHQCVFEGHPNGNQAVPAHRD